MVVQQCGRTQSDECHCLVAGPCLDNACWQAAFFMSHYTFSVNTTLLPSERSVYNLRSAATAVWLCVAFLLKLNIDITVWSSGAAKPTPIMNGRTGRKTQKMQIKTNIYKSNHMRILKGLCKVSSWCFKEKHTNILMIRSYSHANICW